MNESRQQRRARQRAEQKATTRPGPRRDQPPLTAKQPHVIVASLHRNVDDSEPEPGEPAEWVDWSCEYELRGERVGIDDSGNPDLHDVVNGVLDYARQWSDRYDITIEWTVDGDPPEGGTVEDAIAALGVTLPTRIPD
ncbi:hypothetical protein ACFXO9_31385 [Nocardia tengchongensis]|uniref:hypothetical protein n=1 Tax=Nocardia tengchongensis TaxID=2055889 RepID=UPI0036CAF2EC